MMTTATGEITKIETTKTSGRSSPTYRSGKAATTTASTPNSSAKAGTKAGAKAGSGEKSQHRRDEKPPLVVRRGSKADRTAKTHGSIELDPSTDNSSRSVSSRTSFMFTANCDRQSLAAALETFDLDVEDFSSHTRSTSNFEDSQICIVRSDKLAFSGTGIRRHSRRKRNRQLGKDNTKIVLVRQPSLKEQEALAAAEAEAEEARHKLEEECSKHRSDRRLSRANARYKRTAKTNSSPITNRRRKNEGGKQPRQRVSMPASTATNGVPDFSGAPIRSNSVIRIGSSREISGVMMFEDKSEDLDMPARSDDGLDEAL